MYAEFPYEWRRPGHRAMVKSTEFSCGSANLHRALAEAVWRYNLQLPRPLLTVNSNKRMLTLSSTVSVNDEVPCFFYGRKYRSPAGLEELQAELDRQLTLLYVTDHSPDEPMSRIFEKYLAGKTFNEKIIFRQDFESKSKIQGRATLDRDLYIEKEEGYSIDLNDPYVERISRYYRTNAGEELSKRRKNVLRGKLGSLGIERFLTIVDLFPSRSRDPLYRSYKNLQKCAAFLTDVTLSDVKHFYKPSSSTFYEFQ